MTTALFCRYSIGTKKFILWEDSGRGSRFHFQDGTQSRCPSQTLSTPTVTQPDRSLIFGFHSCHSKIMGCRILCGSLKIRPAIANINCDRLSNRARAGNLAACQIPVDVTKVLFQFAQRFALGEIVRELFEVSEPHFAVLPADISSRTHTPIVLFPVGREVGNRKWAY